MRVALVYRGRYHVREALDIEMLAPIIRGAGHELTFLHEPDTLGVTDNVAQAPRLARFLDSTERLAERLSASCAEVVLFSVLPQTYGWARAMAGRVKSTLGIPVVFFGLHPSLVPERIMQDDCVDYVVQGEMEGVVLPLLDALGRGGGLEAVGNLWRRVDGAVTHTPRADLVDLDALPLPDKDLFRPHITHAYSYAAMVSRGCPYQCSFCEETCSKKRYGAAYFRRRSVDTVMRELVAARQRYSFKEVIFKDSYLSGDKKWLSDLMRRYRRDMGLPFKCFCTILGFDEETADLLKAGGCYCIEFGIQTWNESLRRNVLHRKETNEAAFRVFDACAARGLWYDVDHMFNLPGEAEEDHIKGAYCYRNLRCLNRIKVHYLVYLPGADIVEHGRKAGSVSADIESRLAEGWETDFYDQGAGAEEKRAMTAGYAALYKLLPLLSGGLFRWLLAKNRVRYLRRIPGPFMALLQGFVALRGRDRRFVMYLRYYPRKILRALLRRG